MYIYFFFFSSRRRHTRSLRDWSSDVCSSDLDPPNPERINLPQETLDFRRHEFSSCLSLLMPAGSLVWSSAVLSVCLKTTHNAPLPKIISEEITISQLRSYA